MVWYSSFFAWSKSLQQSCISLKNMKGTLTDLQLCWCEQVQLY